MKYLLLLSIFLVGCREEESILNKLTPEEIEVLRNRASQKCLKEEEDDINDIIDRSNNQMSKLDPNDTWEYTYTKDSAVVDTHKMHVWKVLPSGVIFLSMMEEGGTTNHRFIKINYADNTSHFLDLRVKKCAKAFESSSISGSTVTAKIEDPRVTVDSDTYYEVETTYTYDDDYPAWFGVLTKKRIKKTYNDDDDTVKKTENFSWAFKRVSDENLPDNYQDSRYTNRYYCVPTFSKTTGTAVFPLPSASDYALKCTQDINEDMDPDGDGTVNFDINAEISR